MVEYNLITAFLIGLTVGALVIVYGIRLGFKLSAEIRRYKGDETVESDLFKPNRDPAEFDIIDKPKEDNIQ